MELIPCYSSVFYILTITEGPCFVPYCRWKESRLFGPKCKKSTSFFFFCHPLSFLGIIDSPNRPSTDIFNRWCFPPLLLSSSRCLVFLLEQNSQLWAFSHASDGHSVTTLKQHTHTHMWTYEAALFVSDNDSECSSLTAWPSLKAELSLVHKNSAFTHSVCSWARVKAGCQSTNTGLTLHDWEKHFGGLVAIIATWLLGCSCQDSDALHQTELSQHLLEELQQPLLQTCIFVMIPGHFLEPLGWNLFHLGNTVKQPFKIIFWLNHCQNVNLNNILI